MVHWAPWCHVEVAHGGTNGFGIQSSFLIRIGWPSHFHDHSRELSNCLDPVAGATACGWQKGKLKRWDGGTDRKWPDRDLDGALQCFLAHGF